MTKHRTIHLALAVVCIIAGWFFPRLIDLQGASFALLCLISALQTLLMFGVPALLLIRGFGLSEKQAETLYKRPSSLHAGLIMISAVAYTLVGSLLGALAHNFLDSLGVDISMPPAIVPKTLMDMLIATITIGLITAFSEELMFRMALPRLLGMKLGTGWTIALASLAFAALHLNLIAFVPLLFFSFILFRVIHVRGSFLLAVIFHAMYNFSILMMNFADAQPTLGMIGISLIVFIVSTRLLLREERHETDHSGV